MGTNNVDWLRRLMDPANLDICLLCKREKEVGDLTCLKCRGRCPDRDCKGIGTKSWDYNQCSHCHLWLQSQPKGRDWFVYLCNDGYIGMTSDPDARDAEHDEDAGRAIIWHTPLYLRLKVYEAFKFEWALDAMGEWGVMGNKYLANRFKMITGIYPSPDSLYQLMNRPPLYSD